MHNFLDKKNVVAVKIFKYEIKDFKAQFEFIFFLHNNLLKIY